MSMPQRVYCDLPIHAGGQGGTHLKREFQLLEGASILSEHEPDEARKPAFERILIKD